jgi:L-serine deaminase
MATTDTIVMIALIGNGHGISGAGKGCGTLYGISSSGGNFLNHTILGDGDLSFYHRQEKARISDGDGSGFGVKEQ